MIESGNDQEISYEVNGTADQGFFRLSYTDLPLDANQTLETMDFDRDSISNWQEITVHFTHPLTPDTDGDTLPDGWEVMYGLSPLDNGSIDPANGADEIFPGSTSTNAFAYINLPNVQSLGGGTLENFDGDLAPTDRVVDWPSVAATSYAVILLNQSIACEYVSISPSGRILVSGDGRGGFYLNDFAPPYASRPH